MVVFLAGYSPWGPKESNTTEHTTVSQMLSEGASHIWGTVKSTVYLLIQSHLSSLWDWSEYVSSFPFYSYWNMLTQHPEPDFNRGSLVWAHPLN